MTKLQTRCDKALLHIAKICHLNPSRVSVRLVNDPDCTKAESDYVSFDYEHSEATITINTAVTSTLSAVCASMSHEIGHIIAMDYEQVTAAMKATSLADTDAFRMAVRSMDQAGERVADKIGFIIYGHIEPYFRPEKKTFKA